MDKWVVWFYVEPFTLHLNRHRAWHLLFPIVLALVPIPVSVLDTASVIESQHQSWNFYRPQTKLWEGNVFRPVCQSGGVSVWCHFLSWLPGPMSLLGGLCLWSHVPFRQVCPETDPKQRPPVLVAVIPILYATTGTILKFCVFVNPAFVNTT